MDDKNLFREPYEVIVAKLHLADLTIELGKVTRQKWERLATMKDVMKREEELLKEITEATDALTSLQHENGV